MLQPDDAVQQSPDMNKSLTEAERLIRELELIAHPEGGYYRETFRDACGSQGRACSTAIYFLLRAGEVSHWHRVDAAEVWHFHRGAPLELKIAQEGHAPQCFVLGAGIENGERPQIVVPPHAWQSARSLGDYTLAGCTVAPGFEFSKFELAQDGFEPK
jgi:predicted cupin superfamily sugar epimerase